MQYSDMVLELGFENISGNDQFGSTAELLQFVNKPALDAQWDGDCGYSEAEIDALANWMLNRGDEFVKAEPVSK